MQMTRFNSTVALNKLREMSALVQAPSPNNLVNSIAALDMANLFDELDMWLADGGELPREWRAKRSAR